MAKRTLPPALRPSETPDEAAHTSRTLIERAYGCLRDDIVEGRLAPGEKLRVEHLRHHYGVGAGTLREAITRLCSDMLVQAEGQRGFRVAPIALDELQDITDLRVRLETEALRQAVRRGDDGWRSRVRAAFDALSAVEQPLREADRFRWEQLNARFHEALIEPAATPWTLRLLRLLSLQAERYRRLAIGLQDAGRNVHAEHALICESALEGRDARAALALEMHLRATPELLMRVWGETPAGMAGRG